MAYRQKQDDELIYPLDKFVDVLIKLGISPLQLLFCLIIYERRRDLLYKIAEEGTVFPQTVLDELENKGLIVDTNPGTNTKYADFYEVTDEFVSLFYSASNLDGEEFWNAYPGFINIDGKRMPVKGVNKEELTRWYHKSIGSKYDHKKVMSALHFARDNKLIHMRIDRWLQAYSFVDIWELMEAAPKEDLPHDRII